MTLTSRESVSVTFVWNTTLVPKGNYTITTKAHPVFGEIDVRDNSLINGCTIIAMIETLQDQKDGLMANVT